MHDSNFMTFWKKCHYREKKQLSGCQGWGSGRGWTPDREIWKVMESFYVVTAVVVGYTTLTYFKIRKAYTVKSNIYCM